jgi:6-pyruvoyl-tetrahydropterin synthase
MPVSRASSYRKYYDSIEFASKQDDKFLSELFHDIIFEFRDDFTYDTSRSAMKWIFNRIMAHLVMNHLKNWFNLSEEAAMKRWVYNRVPFGLKNMPFFIAVVPQNRKKALEFHWWDQPGKRHEYKFSCPFNKKMTKRCYHKLILMSTLFCHVLR